MNILYASCGGAHLHRTAAEMLKLGQTVWLYTATKNTTQLPPSVYRRCWPFLLAWKPSHYIRRGRYASFLFHKLNSLWSFWLRGQSLPACDVVHSILGLATEAFDYADRIGALKILDASNSHPTSFYGFWQRELDIWNPGARVSLPRWVFAHANREIERADVILCPSTYVRDSMLYNSVPESKLVLNPYGADTAVFTPREELPARPRFLFVGGLTLRKGVQYLVPAFERLQAEAPDAQLILCGGVDADFKKLFEGWKHLFTHMRGLSHPELCKLMHSCTAFVFPSIEEGFARVIPEAMAAGLPIIATHNSGASTVVENGKQGFIVAARSSLAVKEAMWQLVEQPDLCRQMGRAAAASASVSGSWSSYAERLLQIYQTHAGQSRILRMNLAAKA